MAVGIKELDFKVNQDLQSIVTDNDINIVFTDLILIYRGETIQFNFAVTNKAGAPIDFSGDTFLFGIKDPSDMGGDSLADSTDISAPFTDLANGLIGVTIDTNTPAMNTFINFDIDAQGLKAELSAINGGEEKRLVFQQSMDAKTDANQLISSNVALIGSTIPILQLNPDAKVDAKVVAQTTIFEIPAGSVFIPLKLHLLVTDIVGAAVPPTVQFGTTADPDLLLVPELALLNAQYETQSWDIIGAEAIPGGEVLEFGITVASTATNELIIPAFEGYLLSV